MSNTRIGEAQAAGSVRLFSIRHEFPSEWSNFRNLAKVTDQRFELALNLRPEHYPFWSQGFLKTVVRTEILAGRGKVPVIEVSNQINDQSTLVKKDTLKAVKDGPFGDLLVSELTIGLPTKPISEFKLFFNDNTIEDLWLAVTWSSTWCPNDLPSRSLHGQSRLHL